MKSVSERLEELSPLFSDWQVYQPDKLVIIINGNGECGKDYLINNFKSNKLLIKNISSITPAKTLARCIQNHDPSIKDKKNRKLWHSLKITMDEYDESSMKYLIYEYKHDFMWQRTNIIFMHVGEPYNIQLCKELFGQFCPTLALWIDDTTNTNFGDDDPRFGSSEECPTTTEYDEVFHNTKGDKSVKHFSTFIRNLYYKYTNSAGTDKGKDTIPVIIANIPKSAKPGKMPIKNTAGHPIFSVIKEYEDVDVCEIYDAILSVGTSIMSETNIQSATLLVYDEYINLAYKVLHDYSLDKRKYNVSIKRIIWDYSDDCILLRSGEKLTSELLL